MSDKLGKYSLGIGDRFAQQGFYQMQAFQKAWKAGVEITPVWNKSFREHKTVGSEPGSVRIEADKAIAEAGWKGPYLVDADHITYKTVDSFIGSSDFFTIDVADKIGAGLKDTEMEAFLSSHKSLLGDLAIGGIDFPFTIREEDLRSVADKFYKATKEAGRIYRKIKKLKTGQYFAVEVSMDEVAAPQTPLELYCILLLLAENSVPVNTIAPKFTGRFNKGVDYEGDLNTFRREFEQDVLIIRHAVKEFDLPDDLKLSVHTGSDKFSLYPEINRIIKQHDAGLHLKTAGTTWLEELIGLAESGSAGLEMVKSIYQEALEKYDELTGPYSSVLNIDREQLPSIEEVEDWHDNRLSNTIRHNKLNVNYNPHLRQLLHTAYKIAALKGEEFLTELEKNKEIIGKNVKENLLERHIKPLFMD